jgi:peptidoglycan/LPS O-acetylase OafA/YrhL
MLWIILIHSSVFGVWFVGLLGKGNIVDRVVQFGNVGVDMFIFLSGMGLYFSFTKHSEPYPFIKKRFSRVLPSVLLVCVPIWALRFLVFFPDVKVFLQRISLLGFWLKGDQEIWYINFILLFYLLYPYLYHYLFDKGRAVVRCLIALALSLVFLILIRYAWPDFWNNCEIALTRIPLAIFGCYFGKLIYEKRKVPPLWSFVVVAAALAVFALRTYGGLHGIYVRLLLGLGGVLFCYVFAILFELMGRGTIAQMVNKVLGFFGWMSLELYLAHLLLRSVYMKYFMKGSGRISEYFLSVLVALVIAVVARFVLDHISEHTRQRQAPLLVQ